MNDALLGRELSRALPDFSVHFFDSLPSTNAVLRELAALGAPEGTVVIAGMQTAGRGRLGRSFFSPGDTGLYMSLLLRPKLSPAQTALITPAAAVAVCEALERIPGLNPGIKWVNDIFLNGRKVCGILTEAVLNPAPGGLPSAVLGIGVNVYPPEGGFPGDIADVAGSVVSEPQPGLRCALASEILNRFRTIYRELPGGSFAGEYRRRCLCLGKRIRILEEGHETRAVALDTDESCRLRVRLDDGTERILSSGEISVRMM